MGIREQSFIKNDRYRDKEEEPQRIYRKKKTHISCNNCANLGSRIKCGLKFTNPDWCGGSFTPIRIK